MVELQYRRLINRFDSGRIRDTISNNPRVKIYSGILFLCSLISLPDEYRVDKRNILNQWFVKLGWFWTIVLIAPLSFYNLNLNDKTGVARAIFRLVLGTILWFLSVNTFQVLDTSTGFDISGHTFLLIFSNLIISSEIKLHEHLDSRQGINPNAKGFISGSHFVKLKISLRLLTIIWDFMLIQTALYYHSIIQKLIAAVWAFSCWYIMQALFYGNMSVDQSKYG